MSAKRIIFKVTDSAGAPLAGAKIKATDCWELNTNDDGLAVFLIDVEDYTVTVNGKDVYSGKLSDSADSIDITA
ncbi:MAG: hypothetical protein Q4G62_05025 [Pseudomonadota bacterium]|nr:hypothetical protein [Pseudomonadota bacterium]